MFEKLLSFTKDVSDFSDKPTGNAVDVKAQFDAAPHEVREYLNKLIDALGSTTLDSGAKNIGASTIPGLTGTDVQTVLQSMKAMIDNAALGQIPDGSLTSAKLSPSNVSVIPFASSTGVANAYDVTLNPAPAIYVEGMAVSVKIHANSTDVSTLNVNGMGPKRLKKANGNDEKNLKANGVYTFRYNATTGNFILQGEGGSGNLQPNQALSGFTFTNDEGEQVGEGDPDLIPSNIIPGKNIFGVEGAAAMGMKKREGTVTSSSGLVAFRQYNDTDISVSTVTITGLDFIPSQIELSSVGFASTTYDIKSTYNNVSNCKIVITSQTTPYFIKTIAPVQLSVGTIVLPAFGTNTVFKWTVHE